MCARLAVGSLACLTGIGSPSATLDIHIARVGWNDRDVVRDCARAHGMHSGILGADSQSFQNQFTSCEVQSARREPRRRVPHERHGSRRPAD